LCGVDVGKKFLFACVMTGFEGRIKSGNILLSVHADDSEWSDMSGRILKKTGAEDIASASEVKGDYANADKPGPRYRKGEA
jgi:hypothetical protein